MSFMALLLARTRNWTGVGFVLLALTFYLLALRLTRCRVQTQQGTPCKWLVRGIAGTCKYHRGLKHGLPRPVQVPHSLLPTFMWLRPDTTPTATAAAIDPQPAAGARQADTIDSLANQSWYAWATLAISALSALIAVLSFAIK